MIQALPIVPAGPRRTRANTPTIPDIRPPPTDFADPLGEGRMRRMMRRTGFVSRRGAVAVLAVALAAAACFGGIRLVRLLQHRAAAQTAASVRASATAAVADDVDVCDIVPAGTIESATDQQIRRFWMRRFNGELTCMIYFQERIPLNFVGATYKRGPITASIKSSS